jgi:hypothetical protein
MCESPWRIQDSDTARVRDRAGWRAMSPDLNDMPAHAATELRRPAAAPRGGSIDDYRIFFIDGVVCSS